MRTSQQTPFAGTLSGAPVTIALVTVNVLVFLLLMATGGADDNVNLYRWGAKYGPALADGEWWRLIIPVFLHINFVHLLTNSIGLLIFGSMAERLLGSPAYLAIYLITGVLGNVASFIFTPALGAGASGAVFGVIGAFGIYILLNRQVMGEMGQQAFLAVALIIALNIVSGFLSEGVDNAAHVGGLLGGMLMAYLVSPRQRVVLTQGWAPFAPPQMRIQARKQSSILLGIAIAAGIAIAVIGATIRAQDYPHEDIYANCGYSFAEFTEPDSRLGGICRFFSQ